MKAWKALLAASAAIVLILACTKDREFRPCCYLNVRFIDNEDYDFMETVEGDWNFSQHLAVLNANGYLWERFELRLPDILDTGSYPSPTIANIRYTDGQDFLASEVLSGYIHVSELDSFNVRGNFRIYFANSLSGSTSRTIFGNFGIINKP